MVLKPLLLLLLVALPTLVAPRSSHAQGTKTDYKNWEKLGARTRDKVFRQRVEPHWFADNVRFWYRVDLADQQREFVLVNAAEGTRRPAFDHERLLESLSKAVSKELVPGRLPFDRIIFYEDDNAVWFSALGNGWRCDLETYELAQSEAPDIEQKRVERRRRRNRRRWASPRGELSPDKVWRTFTKDHNLFLRSEQSGEEFQLTDDGSEGHYYQRSVFWSPDSTKLVAYRTEKGDERIVHFVESSPKDQLQPKLHSHKYLKPGDKIDMTRPHLFDVAQQKEIPISDELFATPWSLDEVRWDDDSSRFTFRYNQRGHQVLRLIAVDAKSGESTAIINEQSETFLDWAYKQYLYYVDDTSEVIWASERDGWNHLYLYDVKTGKVKNPITSGRWGRARGRSRRSGGSPNLVSGGRRLSGSGSVLRASLPREL